MPTYQTSAQNPDSIWYGSAKIEVSLDNGSTYTDVGLARGVTVNEVIETAAIQADNGEDIANNVSSQTVEVTFNSLEFYLPTLYKMRGNIDTLSQISTGSTTAIDSYSTGGSSADKFIALQNQGTGSTGITISSITQVSTGGTTSTLTVDDDYVRLEYVDDVGVVMRDDTGSSYKSTESLVISYGYDKVQSNNLSSGGISIIDPRWYRLTSVQIVDGAQQFRYIYLYNTSLNGGMNLALKSSNDADPVLEAPISLVAKIDTTRSVGDQLWMIEDRIGV